VIHDGGIEGNDFPRVQPLNYGIRVGGTSERGHLDQVNSPITDIPAAKP